jgi:hypothetical protein
MRHHSDKPPGNNSRAAANNVVQRYTTVNGHRIANDHTAAVKEGVNNKELYATQAMINASNGVLTGKKMPIRLDAGARKDGLVDDRELLTVTPRIEAEMGNLMHDNYSPKANEGEGHPVLLPAECEKGALSIIGAMTKVNKSAGNTRDYEDHEHEKARIGEMLAHSAEGNATKTRYYQDWVRLEEGMAPAVTAYNRRVYPKADIDAMFIALNDPALLNEFTPNFDENPTHTHYLPNWIFSAETKADALFKRIIAAFDKKMGETESRIMKRVDTGTAGQQQELSDAVDLKDVLEAFFRNRDYDKNAIDQVIAQSPARAQLETRIRENFADQGGKYVSTAMFSKDSKLQQLMKDVIADLDKQIAALTQRNTKSLQNGSGLNAEVNPAIGQSYGIIGGHYDINEGGRWNWHWASVIMKTAGDNVTMEAHASHKQGEETHNDRWDFKMYGTAANSNQTFHDEWKSQGFGKAPVTVLGVARDRPDKHAEVTLRGITGLNQVQTQTAADGALALFVFFKPLGEPATNREGLIARYRGGVPDRAGLPAGFTRDFLQTHLDALGPLITDLEAAVLAPDVLLAKEASVREHAKGLTKKLATFYTLAQHYDGHQRKRGVFV